MLLRGGKPEAAIQVLEKGLRRLPDSPNLMEELGHIYLGAKQFEKALTIFEGLRQKQTGQAKFIYYLAFCFDNLKRYKEALAFYNAYLGTKDAPPTNLHGLAQARVTQLKKIQPE
ncbi:MAG: tetratricopeptide repeat protein [Acidobacteria bacterium]|nr:tetratricopeptide repeat protein [Acidobacteriota bacterium]MBI3658810.1 tetratricopeptide repeat protein [Acidobacteriota bacterium]